MASDDVVGKVRGWLARWPRIDPSQPCEQCDDAKNCGSHIACPWRRFDPSSYTEAQWNRLNAFGGLLDAIAGLTAERDRLRHHRDDRDALKENLRITEALLDERERVLRAIPECPAHGAACVPHALEWVERMRGLRSPLPFPAAKVRHVVAAAMAVKRTGDAMRCYRREDEEELTAAHDEALAELDAAVGVLITVK